MREISPGWARFVVALGVTQILGYGAVYYAFPVLVPSVAAEFGIPETWLYGAFSIGLLLSAGVATMAGPWLDRFGAPRVMSVGSVLVAMLLAALGLAPNAIFYMACVILLEAISFLVLYDAAFAALALGVPTGTRKAITRLTLIAGFASTIYWPLTGYLNEAIGWRATYLIFAALNLCAAMPLHLWLARIARDAGGKIADTPKPVIAPDWPILTGPAARQGFWLLAIGFALIAVVIAALGVHLVPLLLALGLGSQAYLVSMAMGPTQVAIRVIDATLWRRTHPLTVALVSCLALVGAILALIFASDGLGLALGFAILFGAGQGLTSIVRGAVPLALFGPTGIGRKLGHLAAMRSVFAAAAPFIFGLGLTTLGMDATLVLTLAITFAGLGLLIWLHRLVQRQSAR